MHDVNTNEQDRTRAARPNSEIREWWKVIVETLTFLAVVWYACVASRQLAEMREATRAAVKAAKEAEQSNIDARDRFRQDQRPYIWLTSNGFGSPKYPASPTGQVAWDWHYTNYGKTPAYDVRFRHYMSIDGGRFIESYGAPKQGSLSPPVPPTQDMLATVVSGPGFTSKQISDAQTIKGKGISIRMKVEYTDAYGGKYETGICLHQLNTGAISYCPDQAENYIK